MGWVSNFTAIVVSLSAIVVAWQAWAGGRSRKTVDAIHGEVRTMNGKTIGGLADAEEGRRIDRDVPVADQTDDDKHYIEKLEGN